MKIHRTIQRSLFGSALLLGSSSAWAITCDFENGIPTPLIQTMNLQGGTISVGRDQPIGAILHRQTFRASAPMVIICTSGAVPFQRKMDLFSVPPLVPGMSNFQGKVYETNVPGIGVAVWNAGTGMPFQNSWNNCGGGTANCRWTLNASLYFDVSLIKTGPISGGLVQGSALPGMTQSFVSENTVTFQRITLAGSINVVVPTCTTPDVNVPLGSHMVHDLQGTNSGTAWRDFDIRLNNCPAISGYFNGSDATTPVWYSDGTREVGTRSNHAVNFQLNPQSGSIDPARGIARLTASRPGTAPAATGIGVQIANRSNQPTPLGSFNPGTTLRAGQAGGQNLSIPLRARYIQVADKVTPGPANAAVEFVLQYH
ncbi:fimbrial protein [Pseudomonas sp. Pseusp97]|uniref:fimbrial protein n=1 Tax=Pseudomonas sp. Pseusp97 TaxID=3243065 RepID=UPI0039A73A64